MTATATRIAELHADAKQVYTVGPKALISLADKYGIETDAMRYYRANPDGRELWSAALGSVARQKEMQRLLYATIKGQLRELGA